MRLLPAACSVAFLAACGPQPNGLVDAKYENANNGQRRTLTLDIPKYRDAVVGIEMPYTITREVDGAQWCRGFNQPMSHWQTGLPNGSVAYTECEPVAETPTVVEIVRTWCDDGMCEARGDGTVAVVTPLRSGNATLTVVARMSSGPDLTDMFEVGFRQPHAIDVRCDDSGLCPGVHSAIFEGASMRWEAVVTDVHGGPLFIEPDLRVEPADALSVKPVTKDNPVNRHRTFLIRALKPGNVTITLTGGAVTWSHTFRVASYAEAMSGAVHARAARGVDPSDDARPDSTFDFIGPAATEIDYRTELLFVWKLTDGTRAVGGSGDSLHIAAGYGLRWRRDYNTSIGIWVADVGVFTLGIPYYPCEPGPGEFKGRVGKETPAAATIQWPVALKCG